MKLVCLILGGSLNPITIAHLRMLELAKDYVTQVLGRPVRAIITPVGDHYPEKKLAKAALRIEMAKAAVAGEDWITVDDWESKQPQWKRTKEVLTHYQQQMPDASVTFLAGSDLIHSFERPGLWKDEDIEEILTKFGIMVVRRLGSEEFDHVHHLLRDPRFASGITSLQEWMPNGISSTLIRRAVKEGKSIKYWTPDPVIEIIHREKLYKE